MMTETRADAVAEEPHARISVPSVTPVAAKMMFAGREVLRRVDLRKSVMPIARQRSSCSGLLTTRRAKISPFRQRIAAAVSTPSGAPPVPITACTPVPTTAAAMPADRSPSPIRRIRAPVARISAIRSRAAADRAR